MVWIIECTISSTARLLAFIIKNDRTLTGVPDQLIFIHENVEN